VTATAAAYRRDRSAGFARESREERLQAGLEAGVGVGAGEVRRGGGQVGVRRDELLAVGEFEGD
jgi:hypothetical protein